MSQVVATQWESLHSFVAWRTEDVDDFLTTTVGPAMRTLRESGRISDWFFIRYWEGGPHVRIRFRGADATVGTELATILADAVAAASRPVIELGPERYYASLGGDATATEVWYGHGQVVPQHYEPETRRYGGEAGLVIAEDVFCRSSEIALAIVGATTVGSSRLSAAVELAMATTIALDLDRAAAAAWLRTHGSMWRWVTETSMIPAVAAQAKAVQSLVSQPGRLGRRWETVAQRVAAAGTSAVAVWAKTVRDARAALENDQAPARAWLQVWASQLHMLYNRIGVSPEEERSLCWALAASALSPDGVADFFADGADAVDRRYLEASKFLPGAPGQDPRASTSQQQSEKDIGARTELDPPRVVDVPLAQALVARKSGRGRLVGPVTSADLATLLWTAQGIVRASDFTTSDLATHRLLHRPYPAAGGRYVTRTRLAVFDVDGLAPGSYLVDEHNRCLRRFGAAPSLYDLEGTSTWFGSSKLSLGGLDVTAVPAVLALSVDVTSLRERYGLRALRFALLESGHLAQNLALVAAATGLALGMVGGFYDDVAHEVFGLDGTDDMLVYLMPLGRKAGDFGS